MHWMGQSGPSIQWYLHLRDFQEQKNGFRVLGKSPAMGGRGGGGRKHPTPPYIKPPKNLKLKNKIGNDFVKSYIKLQKHQNFILKKMPTIKCKCKAPRLQGIYIFYRKSGTHVSRERYPRFVFVTVTLFCFFIRTIIYEHEPQSFPKIITF